MCLLSPLTIDIVTFLSNLLCGGRKQPQRKELLTFRREQHVKIP